jgi:hypothetical protein
MSKFIEFNTGDGDKVMINIDSINGIGVESGTVNVYAKGLRTTGIEVTDDYEVIRSILNPEQV